MPASDGPTIVATFRCVLLRATAALRSFLSTRLGTTAWRVGVSAALANANSTAATSSAWGEISPNMVSTVKLLEMAKLPIWMAISSRRRSSESASMPPKMASLI